MATSNPSAPTPATPRPAIYHISTSTYATSLSARKSKYRDLILHDRRISQYRALLKLKSVKFSDAELVALRNAAPHFECEKALRKKVQEARWRCEEELGEFKKEAKEIEAELRKELDMRIGNQRVVHRDNEKLLEENEILKADIVAWKKENDKIMEANNVLVEELKVSNEDNEDLMVSIDELSREVEDLQKQLRNATATYKKVAEVSKKWNEALTKQNDLCLKQREEMMENDAQREVVLQRMREEMQARDERIKLLEETEKDVVLKKMREEMQVKDERMKFLAESEQERLNQLRGMRRERDGLPECGCVTPRCTCEEGGYEADDDMMEWIRQNGVETNRESDTDYDADNTSDDCESEDYESEYESNEEDSECEEGEMIKSLPAANNKLNDHIETWMEDALAQENNLKESEEQGELKKGESVPSEDAKLKAEVGIPHKDALAKEEHKLKEDEEDAELKEELEMATLQAEITQREAYLAKEKYNSLKALAERSLLAETQQKARESKEVELKSKSLEAGNDELKTDVETSRKDILAKEESNLIKDVGGQSLLEETHKTSEPSEELEAGKSQGVTSSSVFTDAMPIESDRRDNCDLTSSVINAGVATPIKDASSTKENNLTKDMKEPRLSAQTDKEAPSKELDTPTNLPGSTSSSIFTASTTTTESALDFRHLIPSIFCAPTPAPSVCSTARRAGVALLREDEENEAREASRKWWTEEQAGPREQKDEAEERRFAVEVEKQRLEDEAAEKRHVDQAEEQSIADEAQRASASAAKKKNKNSLLSSLITKHGV